MGTSNDGVVGTTVGLFDILYECDFKSNDGHRMFHIKCRECGWEGDRQYRHIKETQYCAHVNKIGNYFENNYEWENKRIKAIFNGMKDRCYNPNNKAFRWYGAKGIKVCDEWLGNPKLFEEWALSNGYDDNLTIDRIDETKDYCPENCRWKTNEDNAKYKSTTRITTVDEVSHSGKEWADVLNLGTNTINTMLRNYPEDQVKEFIRRRMADMNKTRRSHQTWMNVYSLE